jgi:DNA modification methylase
MDLRQGDCLQVLKELPDNSVDSLITDPPAGISFMGKEWDEDKGGRKQWIEWMSSVMKECMRVMKPGAHGLVWAIPRTSHWTATALEDAGFEVRDVVTHIFGSGFPKSLDISKAIDKAAGAERERIPRIRLGDKAAYGGELSNGVTLQKSTTDVGITLGAPATPDAKRWQGWGTALKPASEHWILVRKPCSEKTLAANVLKHGTGGVNIDASRIGTNETLSQGASNLGFHGVNEPVKTTQHSQGRFPANLVLSHNDDCVEVGTKKVKGSNPVKPGGGLADKTYGVSNNIYSPLDNKQVFDYTNPDGTETVAAFECTPGCAVAALDAQSGVLKTNPGHMKPKDEKISSYDGGWKRAEYKFVASSGGASRFFYCAKASKRDKGADNTHPTVKSSTLMSYLIKLITPPKGLVLDPFMGSGSTGVACQNEGFGFIGIEQSEEYFNIAFNRIYAKVEGL